MNGGHARGGGTDAIDHVSFATTGLAEILERLEARSIQPLRRTVPEDGSHQVFFDDPNAIRIELTFDTGEFRYLGDDQ